MISKLIFTIILASTLNAFSFSSIVKQGLSSAIDGIMNQLNLSAITEIENMINGASVDDILSLLSNSKDSVNIPSSILDKIDEMASTGKQGYTVPSAIASIQNKYYKNQSAEYQENVSRIQMNYGAVKNSFSDIIFNYKKNVNMQFNEITTIKRSYFE